MVSAPSLAKAAGVKTSYAAGDSNNVIVTVSGDGNSKMSVTGCVCGDKSFLTGNNIAKH